MRGVMIFIMVATASLTGAVMAEESCAASLSSLKSQHDNPAYGRYRYWVDTQSGQNRRNEQFDPGRQDGDRWRLVTVDGEAPTEKQVRKNRQRRAQAQSGYLFDHLFDPHMLGSLQPLERGPGWQSYAFKPTPSDDDDEVAQAITEQLSGQLVFRQHPQCLIEYQLRNTEPLKPAAGVRVKEMEVTIRLEPLPETGVFYPKTVKQRVVGKAFLVKRIEEVSESRYSGHEMVLPK